ncbi:MAG: tetratricopeptide repeat protein [bacterium]|nr:tetratricopeptide repeat protein [bacterium]
MVSDGEKSLGGGNRLVGIVGALLLLTIPLVYFPFGFRPFLWSKLLVVQAGVVIAVGVWAKCAWENRVRPGWFALDVPVLSFFVITVSSFWMATNLFKGSLEVVKLATFVCLYLAISRTVRTGHLSTWSRAIAGVSGLVSIIGIGQYLGIAFLGIPSGGYPSATFLYRNFLAMYLIMALPLTILPYVLARSLKAEIFWGVTWALPFLMLIYTRTRGAWVGLFGALLLVGGVAVVAFKNRSWPFLNTLRTEITRRKIILTFVFLSVILLAAQVSPRMPSTPGSDIPPDKISALSAATSILEKQSSGRLPVWHHTLDMIRDYWLFGAGIGNWEVLYPRYARGDQVRPGFTFLRPHNDYLWVASELGIVGLTIYIWLILAALWAIFCALRTSSDLHSGLMLAGTGIAILAMAGHAFFSFPRERIPPSFLFWFLLGVVAGISPGQSTCSQQAVPRSKMLLPAVCMLAILVGVYPVSRAFFSDWAQFDAEAHFKQEDWEGTRLAAQRSIEWGVWDYRIYLLKSDACLKLGDLQGALEASRVCLKVHPNSISAYQNIGKIAAALDDLEQAREAFVQALELDPDNAELYRDLGVVYRRMERPDNALSMYREALVFLLGDMGIWYNIGELYRIKGDLEAAEEIYGRLIKEDPDFFAAYIGLGEVWQVTGKRDAAIVAYQKAAKLAPEIAEPYYNLGELYRAAGLTDPAARMYRAFLERWQGDVEVAEEVRRKIERLAGH